MILMLGDPFSYNKVDNMGKSGSVARDGKEMLIGEWVSDVSCTKNVETR